MAGPDDVQRGLGGGMGSHLLAVAQPPTVNFLSKPDFHFKHAGVVRTAGLDGHVVRDTQFLSLGPFLQTALGVVAIELREELLTGSLQ